MAWAARQLGHKSVVYMPKGQRTGAAGQHPCPGAQAEITDLNYDDAVRLANRMGQEHGWILVQDTAWPGYEEIPAWIMEGYTTIAWELFQQLEDLAAGCPPTCSSRPEWAASRGNAGQLCRAYGEGLSHHLHRGARPGRLPVPERPGGGRAVTSGHRGDEQHDGRALLRRAVYHQLEIIPPRRGGLPVLLGRVLRHGDAPAGAAGAGDPAVVSGESGAVGVGAPVRHPA